ncbi:DUF423 domain-containing protein [Hydrocarboniclastica marina]|uniref:DUF423 domain-containing protein n=1 Tax=Hydrocarboniclastica marina TaxID=2259620 RepID=A0A4P7XK68_9ALTE|nr:DUF423 domain-containing protein [Hydrocarboniclastica marina]
MDVNLKSFSGGATWLLWSGLLGFVGVGAGAFGAHALRGVLNERLMDVYQTAVHYQMLHALALGLVAVLVFVGIGGAWPRRAGFCFVAGTVVFSGSLYLLSLTATGWFGAITPVGGVLFLGGWVALLIAGLHARREGHTSKAG